MSNQASPWSLCACFCVFKSLINTVSPLRLDSLSRCCVSMPDRYEKAHRSRPVRVCYTIDPDWTGWTDFLILFWTYSIFRSTLLSYINDFALVCMSVIAPCFIPLPEFYFDFLWIKKKRLSFRDGFGSGGTAVHVPTERLVVWFLLQSILSFSQMHSLKCES